jgi:hypothetical protein
LALEIHRNFNAQDGPEGEIDRILNGGEPIEKRLPESDEEIALRKKQIEIQLREYAEAMAKRRAVLGRMEGGSRRASAGQRRGQPNVHTTQA